MSKKPEFTKEGNQKDLKDIGGEPLPGTKARRLSKKEVDELGIPSPDEVLQALEVPQIFDPSTLRPFDPSTLRQTQDGAGSGRRRLRGAQTKRSGVRRTFLQVHESPSTSLRAFDALELVGYFEIGWLIKACHEQTELCGVRRTFLQIHESPSTSLRAFDALKKYRNRDNL